MATLDAFRTASGDPLKLDFANDYMPDVRLNAGDVNGRTITVEIWDDGMPVDTDGLAATLAYNTSPGRDLGDRVAMTAVPDTETATYTVPVPRKALARTGRILLGIELEFHGSKICSRNFDGIVERAVFDAQSPETADTMGQLEKLIDAANTATSKADAAGDKAEKAARTRSKRRKSNTRNSPTRSNRPSRPWPRTASPSPRTRTCAPRSTNTWRRRSRRRSDRWTTTRSPGSSTT